MLVWLLTAIAGPDVVMVGNSYMQRNDLPGELAAMLDATAAPRLEPRALDLALPGRTWSDHAARLDGEAQFQAAFEGPRDVVVLQEQSQTPGFPEGDPGYQASMAAGQRLHAAAGATGAVTVLMNTWGRRDGDEQNPALYPDYDTMQARLDEGYRRYQEQWTPTPTLAPIGRAWRQVWTEDEASFRALYDNDGSHPSAAGTFLAGVVLTAAITGRNPRGGGDGLPEEVRGRLLEVGQQAVFADPFGADAYAWAWDTWAAWEAAGGGPVSGALAAPWVRLREGALEAVVVGASHPEGAGEGRLVLDGDVTLGAGVRAGDGGLGLIEVWSGVSTVERLVLGDGAGGRGELHVRGGALAAAWIDRGFGDGEIVVEGGELRLDGPCGVSVTLVDGALGLGGGGQSMGGDLTQRAGTVRYEANAPLQYGGDVSLDGVWELGPEVEAGDVLLEAASITLGAVEVRGELSSPAFEVVDVGARQALRLVGPVDPGGPLPQLPVERGCGCESGRGPAWAVLLLVLLHLGRPTRRQPKR